MKEVSPLRLFLAQQCLLVVQWVLVFQWSWDPHTEGEGLGKAQLATQHSHLELPGTWASAEKNKSQIYHYNINHHVVFYAGRMSKMIKILQQLWFCTLSAARTEPSSSPPPNFHFPPERQHWSPFSAAWITCTEETRAGMVQIALHAFSPLKTFIITFIRTMQ